MRCSMVCPLIVWVRETNRIRACGLQTNRTQTPPNARSAALSRCTSARTVLQRPARPLGIHPQQLWQVCSAGGLFTCYLPWKLGALQRCTAKSDSNPLARTKNGLPRFHSFHSFHSLQEPRCITDVNGEQTYPKCSLVCPWIGASSFRFFDAR